MKDITLNVYDEVLLDAATQLSTKDKPLRIHVKVDSGMGRLGVRAGEEAVAFVEKAVAYEGIDVEGLFTHFAKADETNKSYTYEQYRLFHSVVEALQAKGIEIPLIHSGNSATGIEFPELSYNMVRLGVSMYGLYPSDEVDTTKVALQPVMSLKTALTMVKKTEAGSGISYGTIYHTAYEEWIGTLPVGYADGYTRMLTGKTSVLVRGQRVPVVGRICMDQCMVSLHGLERVEEIAIGEEVVLMGRQGDEVITAEELAHTLGTINYEITCMVAARIPRVYIRDGIEVAIVNPLW
jgi:alanine racemase